MSRELAIEARIKNQETEPGPELKEISTGCFASSARESMVEEPGAGKPHSGICAGVLTGNRSPYCDGKYLSVKARVIISQKGAMLCSRRERC